MAPKRYSIYPSAALDTALDARTDRTRSDAQSRSSLISAFAERYHEICRRSMPALTLREWLLILDAMNGVWTQDQCVLAASGLAHQVSDACTQDLMHERHGLSEPEARALVDTLAHLPFAGQIAVIDACERLRSQHVQPDREAERTEADPFAHWREPVSSLVGRLADDD